jgi:hypothetical protein
MPEISRFLGIILRMYRNDHAPPHFHVRYGSENGTIRLDDLDLLEGSLPPRILRLVREWAIVHRGEWMENWQRVISGDPPQKIEGLE